MGTNKDYRWDCLGMTEAVVRCRNRKIWLWTTVYFEGYAMSDPQRNLSWQDTLQRRFTLCNKFGTKSTYFEFSFQSAKGVHQHHFLCRLLMNLEKQINTKLNFRQCFFLQFSEYLSVILFFQTDWKKKSNETKDIYS